MKSLLLLLPALWLAGCAENSDPRGTRVAVRGTVTLNGQPLNHARVVFQPATGNATITATGSIVDGAFSIPAEYGPSIGTMRVSIEPETVDLEEFHARKKSDFRNAAAFQMVRIPAKYNRKTKLTVAVSEDERQNTYRFQLTTR